MKNSSTDFLKGILSVLLVFSLLIFAIGRSTEISTAFANVAAAVISGNDLKNDKSSVNNSDDGGQTTTTSSTDGNSTETMNRVEAKDSEDDSDIKKTPKDIALLMDREKKEIKKQKKLGKTSEEHYFGGGKLEKYDGVEVQNKIPSSFYDLDLKKLMKEKIDLSVNANKDKPTVLIYHSHTTEAYTLLDVGYYTASFDMRCKDTARNMVRVGDEIAEYLEKSGIGVIHDREIHDEDYNSAYDSSRKSIKKYLEQYPSIKVTIDVHRDDITYNNKTKVKPTVKIDGKKAAKMMIIAGCEYGRVKDFPKWEENLKFDLAVQKKMSQTYNGIMRPILFSERKYNMDMTKYSFLLEVGTDANTLDEACYSGRLFGKALGEMLKNDFKK